MEETLNHEHSGYDGNDHPHCLRCHRPLKNPKWRKLGYGRKCYALAHQGAGQAPADTQDLVPVAEEYAAKYHQVDGRQDRAPDPQISKAEKRAALDAALQEEMARPNPEPTEAQRRAAEQRLKADVDKALGGEEDGEHSTGSHDPYQRGEDGEASKDAEEEHPKQGKKKVKAPKGQVMVRPGAFNRSSRSMMVNVRDSEPEN